jgi:hypothetical protein
MKLLNSFLLVSLAALVGCAKPSDGDQLRFSHKLHVDNDVGCIECHTDIVPSSQVGTGKRPGHDQCVGCHDNLKDNCALCHTKPDQVRALPRHATRDLNFSHELHVEAVEGDCKKCHATMVSSREPGADRRNWTHTACMECHRDQYRAMKCEQCHQRMTEWKDKPFAVFNHDGDFMGRHGQLARGEKVVCSHCHTDDKCAECHSTLQPTVPAERFAWDVSKPHVHRGDFKTRHAMEAGLDRMRCFSCHESRQCAECHQESGVARAGAAFKHPDGWMKAGSPNHHGRDARSKIGLCAGCHDRGEKTSCIVCHRPGGTGGNPHPGREMDSSLNRERDMPCRLCHG